MLESALLMSIFGKLFSTAHTASVKAFEPIVAQINAFEPAVKALSDEELKAKTSEFKERLKSKQQESDNSEKAMSKEEEEKILTEILPEAFALVREAARRTLGQRHFDVQLVGGMVLNSGGIAEMKTGEGKTLVATLSAYLNALSE